MSDTAVNSELEVVQAFLGALERLDLDAAMAHADPGIVYQNVPIPPARGADATERVLRTMLKPATGFAVEMHNIAGNGPIVLTERTDTIRVRGFEASFWVCGTFEVRDGRIVLWRDRFDYADVLVASLRGGARAALKAVRRG